MLEDGEPDVNQTPCRMTMVLIGQARGRTQPLEDLAEFLPNAVEPAAFTYMLDTGGKR